MEIIKKKKNDNDEDQVWEDPLNPEAPSDARDKEQLERQLQEVKRINANLTGANTADTEKQK